MISETTFTKLAVSLPQVIEKPHFEKNSFRIKEKIFATLDPLAKTATLKLSAAEQSVYCQIRPAMAAPATGAWGKQGWTIFDLKKASKAIMQEALQNAYTQLAQKVKPGNPAAKKTEEMIQTLHPDKTRTNKRISLEKYNTIKDTLLKILKKKELTHTDLMEAIYQEVKDFFVGGVQWYGETVKLDLEARRIIERTGTKPEKYRLKQATLN